MGKSMKIGSLLAGVALLAALQGAQAAVTQVASNGFTLQQNVVVSASPAKVYAMLIRPSRWWSSDHTFSGSAANMSLEARAGGCFCEKLPGGGSVRHLNVILAEPGKTLRLEGMLGPFQSVAGNGVMTWTIAAAKDGTHLELTYQIAGNAGFSLGGKGYGEWSKAADAMLAEQIARLKRALETGSPR
jgi:uncharacterized protein YndB with AHSA1/START domain